MSIEKQMLVEARVANEGKSTVIAFLLWIFLGTVSAHRFYLDHIGSAFLQFTLLLSTILFLPMFIVWAFWILIDLFMIPSMVRANNNKLRLRLLEGMGEGPQQSKETLEQSDIEKAIAGVRSTASR